MIEWQNGGMVKWNGGTTEQNRMDCDSDRLCQTVLPTALQSNPRPQALLRWHVEENRRIVFFYFVL